MLRSILVVLAGYVAMAVAVILGLFVLVIFFPEMRQALEENRPAPVLATAINLAWAFPAAVLGGFTTAYLAKSSSWRHVAVLAALVLVLGIGYALMQLDSQQPIWYLLGLPLFGSAGVLVGGRLKS